MSKLYNFIVQTSETHSHKVIVTAQRINNDSSGNPRYGVQVWAIHDDRDSGNLWCPIVKGYRLNKNDQYILQSYSLDNDIWVFIQAFERVVKHV